MNWEKVERRLERGFTARPRKVGTAQVIERRRPFPLARIMDGTLTDEERETYGDLESWPGSVSELLEESEVDEEPLLSFYWDGFGPVSWVAGLVLIGNGRRRYLCFWDETESYQAVAAVDPWDDELALSAVVARLLARNGTGFGLGLFGSLPSETTNAAPELVPCPVVAQAYFDLMQWWEREKGDAWLALAEEHFGQMVEPNHLQRCLDIISGLPRLDDPEAVHRWVEERAAESAAIPDHARQRLFDEWFADAYVESDRAAVE